MVQRNSPTAEDYASALLLSYCAIQWPGYRIGRHHRRIAEALQRVEAGECRRLIITMPPRHGKSMLASEYFPAWYLGRNPGHSIIAATYSQDLADDFGRRVRAQIADPLFGAVFPGAKIAGDSSSVKRLHVESAGDEAGAQRGAYFAVGAGGPLTGRGAHLLLIDDPIKGREEADSELARRRLRDWYTSTAYTRLMPGARIVLIQTRWHEDDLAGWLLREHSHEGWEVLSLPAIGEAGEALWPEQYPLDVLNRIKASIGDRDWQALYQQSPTNDSGGYFQRAWLREWERLPAKITYYGASDYAVTADAGDYTVHRIWGIDPAGVLYRVDGWRGQTASDEWIERKLDLIQRYKPQAWFGEAGVIQKAVEPMLIRRMRERGIFCRMEWVPSIHDKPTRCRGFQARASMGAVRFEPGAEVDEFVRFPAGRHDDEVDVAGLIGRALDEAHPAIAAAVPVVRPKIDRWARAFGDHGEGSDTWKTA